MAIGLATGSGATRADAHRREAGHQDGGQKHGCEHPAPEHGRHGGSLSLPPCSRLSRSGLFRGRDLGTGGSVNLTRTKTIEQSIRDTEEGEHQLRKELGAVQLTVFGVGVVIGTGIFVLTGEAAGEKAGPAVALSFVFSGLACALAALCYAEFASTVPVAGSAYTFSYASLGELVAWIIGWDLILELALGASTVAVGLVDLLRRRHGRGRDRRSRPSPTATGTTWSPPRSC